MGINLLRVRCGKSQPMGYPYRTLFLPAMAEHHKRLVEYSPKDVEKLVVKFADRNFVERILVLVAHDESTSQANDSQGKMWVLDGEHAIKKKGPGRGLHQSDCICSTIGWLKNGSQTLEYDKNYDGYWTGELFVKQVCHSRSHIRGVRVRDLLLDSIYDSLELDQVGSYLNFDHPRFSC